MKARWILILLVLIVIGLVSLMWRAGMHETPQQATDLPWHIEITPEGHTRVFGLEIGGTTLEQASRQLRIDPEVALFEAPDGSLRLESYLGKIELGPFQARVILQLQASDALLAEFAANSIDSKPTPSGNRQHRLTAKDFAKARQLVIRELSYAPAVDTEPELIENLFGSPSNRIPLDADNTYWLYPDKGLAILIDQQGKEVFHYVAPREYPAVKARIDQLKQAAQDTSAAS